MSVTFGIYIGCSSCCIAVHKDGKSEVVANAAGDRVTPALVSFHDNEVVTGLSAKQGIIRHAGSTIQGVLRVAGVTEEEGCGHGGYEGTCTPNWEGRRAKYSVQRGEKTVTIFPEDVLTHIFTLLKDIASAHTSDKELPAVVTLPGWSSEGTVMAVKKAANRAAFTIMATITHPPAALLAYGLADDNKHNLNVVVVHCGGTTVSGAVLEVAGGLVTTRESITTTTTAGDTITQVLVQHFAKEFYGKYKGDPLENRRSRRKLYNASENCKHVLSTMNTAQVYVESLWEGVDFSTTLSRARFDGLVVSTLANFLTPAKEAVQRCSLDLSQIDKVILTGGSAKIPRLQRMAAETFPQATVLRSIPPDEVLATGAAQESALLLSCPTRATTNTPVSPPSSTVPALATSVFCTLLDVEDAECECVFSRGTPTHSRRTITLPLPAPSPPTCSIVVYEVLDSCPGQDIKNLPKEDAVLAQVDVTNLTTDSKQLRLDFHLKSDGSLHVILQETEAKINRSFVIESDTS
ncbi:hypothetical protein Pmani_014820 [Petrolisthes manimaculis]|uniref:Heat shock 70 kDa protein 14 n=1 Tax=Petrolisthes manimaculis TaxID=1843537 RepID=A0AAE1PSW5_9EUCA|nr:hypothetical protein Pmani_014820 [Petrolisthes manimaculis]